MKVSNDLVQQPTFEANGLPSVRRLLSTTGDAAMESWLTLAPAAIHDRVDAALYLYVSRQQPQRALHNRLRTGVLCWWLARAETQSISAFTTKPQLQRLDASISGFLSDRQFELDLAPFIGRTEQPREKPEAHLRALLPRACAAAEAVLPLLEQQNYRLWDQSHRKVPDRPWAWLLVYALPRLVMDDELARLIRTAVQEAQIHPRTIAMRLEHVDGDIARVIRRLVE